MNKLSQIEDRYLLLGLTVVVFIAFMITKDPILSDNMKYLIGATVMVLRERSSKTLVVGSDPQVEAIAKEFMGKDA